jgi:alkanesulfonate monooxygenase SsuD/methylene tetrahydromethanopterin reductase-like flavin-dependent oxidoreductase (luciferase family)
VSDLKRYYYAQTRAHEGQHWSVVGDEAHSIEQAESYALRYADDGDYVRVVAYYTPLDDTNFNDRMVD